MPNIFETRINFKPFEYPEVEEFKKSINHSYWLISEWNFKSDVQDFKVELNDKERNTVKRAMLAISQIEVAVKKFWGKIGDRFPKPEIDQVGATFAESEVRHSDSYSHLLNILGLNDDFKEVLKNPVIKGRVEYLQKYLKNASDLDNKDYCTSLTLFSLFVENVSLFSQFAIIKSFNKHKNVLKDIDNVVTATQQEEQIHALFGIWLINQIKKENPKWFNEDFYTNINKSCKKAYQAESKIIDWIFEDGDLEFIDAETLKEFIKHRFNESLEQIGGKKIFETNIEKLKNIKWLIEELHGLSNFDFFYKRSTNYSINANSVTEEDLF